MKVSIREPQFCNEIGRRSNNEDNIYPKPFMATTSSRLFLVCDGMGGHEKGEVASDVVSRSVADYWIVNNELPDTGQKVDNALYEAVGKLNEADDGNGEKKMGTTLTLASITDEGILVAHVGDSRIYQVRPGKGIVFRTKDHSLVQKWVNAGMLTSEEAKTHPQRNVITRAVQPGDPENSKADAAILTDLEDGDFLFMCTDGITETIDDTVLAEILSAGMTDAEKMDRIIGLCREHSNDNFSAYLIPLSVQKDAGDRIKNVLCSTDDLLTPDDRRDLRNREIERQAEEYVGPVPLELLPLNKKENNYSDDVSRSKVNKWNGENTERELIGTLDRFLSAAKDCLNRWRDSITSKPKRKE